MRGRGIYLELTPTWFDGFWTTTHEVSVVSPAFRCTLAASDARRRQRATTLVARVLKSGEVCSRSDMWWFYAGKSRGEASAVMFANLQYAGMPPREIVRAVTTNAAEMLG